MGCLCGNMDCCLSGELSSSNASPSGRRLEGRSSPSRSPLVRIPSFSSSSLLNFLPGVSMISRSWFRSSARSNRCFCTRSFSAAMSRRVESLCFSISINLFLSWMHLLRYASSCEGARGGLRGSGTCVASGNGDDTDLTPSTVLSMSIFSSAEAVRLSMRQAAIRGG